MVIALSTGPWLLAAGFWLAIGSAPSAQAGLVKHAPVSSHSPKTSARPPAEPGLSISITDGHTSATRGDHLRYVVTVRNAGAATARNLHVTLSLPPYLSVNSASQQAVAKAGKVTWHATVRPGKAASFTAATVVGKTPRGMGHLAVVACAAQHAGTPVVCAAHLDRLPGAAGTTSSTSGTAPGTASGASGGLSRYLFAGLAVLACALAAALTARRVRGRKTPGHAR
ncbi:MAG TPA: hypothetical protein VFI65_17920 [Streptosporangiaceae bacterium]|nr:hypothetical protein [Streptosporangiaceae bacterium]